MPTLEEWGLKVKLTPNLAKSEFHLVFLKHFNHFQLIIIVVMCITSLNIFKLCAFILTF
jgi:hypothetical protein